MSEPIKLTDRPTPETDAVTFPSQYISVGDGEAHSYELVEADHARRLEQQRDAAVEVLLQTERQCRFSHDGSETCKQVIENAQRTIAAIKEAK